MGAYVFAWINVAGSCMLRHPARGLCKDMDGWMDGWMGGCSGREERILKQMITRGRNTAIEMSHLHKGIVVLQQIVPKPQEDVPKGLKQTGMQT